MGAGTSNVHVVDTVQVDHVDLFTNKRTQYSTKTAPAVQTEDRNSGNDGSTGEGAKQSSAWQTLELNP